MPTIEQELESNRRELLDLSNRNRLLSLPVDYGKAKIVEVVDERSDNVFEILVNGKKRMRFRPVDSAHQLDIGVWNTTSEGGKAEGVGTEFDAPLTEGRFTDKFLQTQMNPERLQRRLLALYRDALTSMEEHGVNIMYLAIGRLKWFESNSSDMPRYAPLILVPVQLDRKNATSQFGLSWREEDVEENLSLREKLLAEHGIVLPDFPNDEELVPTDYFNAVSQVIGEQERWEVEPNAILLGFFSFAKFLMYRDLDPENWPAAEQLLEHESLNALLFKGFTGSDAPFPENANLDDLIPASKLDHVVEADSSQTVAIEMVRQGRSLIIQGPPGTGKSQSITNIIAAAVLDGKKVLFVAEKLTALQVVKRKLENEGLDSLCLELHSNKANKGAVLSEIDRTWQLGRPRDDGSEFVVEQLEQIRGRLNAHAALVHRKLDEPHGLSPFEIIGKLALLDDKVDFKEDLPLVDDLSWDPAAFMVRRDLAKDMAARLAEMEPPSKHPWRGIGRESMLNIDLPNIKAILEKAEGSLNKFQENTERLAKALHQPYSQTLAACAVQLKFAQLVTAAPQMDRGAVGHAIWYQQGPTIKRLVANGTKLDELNRRYAGVFNGPLGEKDLRDIRKTIAQNGTSLFRHFNKDYRLAISELKSQLTNKPPGSLKALLLLLDDQEMGRTLVTGIEEFAQSGQDAFGSEWASIDSNWTILQRIVDWMEQGRTAHFDFDFRNAFVQIEKDPNWDRTVRDAEGMFLQAQNNIDGLCSELSVDKLAAFGEADVQQVPLTQLLAIVTTWIEQIESLTGWCTWRMRTRQANELGLGAFVQAIEGGRLASDELRDAFDRSYLGHLLRQALKTTPELGQFDGLEHNRVIEEFRKVDKDRLALSKYRVLQAHHRGMPSRVAGVGATGVVMSEIMRQRGRLPIRKLLGKAGAVIQGIKPVFMMSPLSVAQYLQPGGLEFDLLVVDEASQVRPVDALGAFIRCKQYVVVGDSKQLPPTSFFSKLTSNETDERIPEEEMPNAHAKDMESILDLCEARGLNSEMLRWHYRSEHESLIAVSNKEYYDNKLFILPSSLPISAELGLRFSYVDGAVYDRGGSATNRKEAEDVCHAVIEHARNSSGLSLGVVAFSVKQQDLIRDVLENMRKANPELEEFFGSEGREPFFVKNLESVQGDERDVIFISVGYGPDANGYMAMNFGPLSNNGGERRLNVLISRAKKRCQVFASFRSTDINLELTQAIGVRGLKSFLQYAETGKSDLSERTSREFDSPFEEAVCNAIQKLGYEVHPQVGISGFFIDLAVVDPAKRGRYLLGVECDGATYHSSRSARERDRLREAVLVDHGWKIHRIWSTDWFQRKAEQIKKLKTVIEEAKVGTVAPSNGEIESTGPPHSVSRDRPNSAAVDLTSKLSVPYREASFFVPRDIEPHEVSLNKMADIVRQIVVIEGPIHKKEVVSRIRDLWHKKRGGSRIEQHVSNAIAVVVRSSWCHKEEDCLWISGQDIPIRNRSSVRSSSLRKPELIPPVELRAAIRAVVKASHGADEAMLTTTVARLMGFGQTTASLKTAIGEQIEKMVQKKELTCEDGVLRTPGQ